MTGNLEAVVRAMFDALDRNDPEAAIALAAEDSQGIDELSRHWMRGRGELADYMRQLMGMVKDVRSSMRDVHEVAWGEVGVVTFWLEQDYTIEGKRQHISAPSSVVLRRVGDAWKIVLFHSIPLPEEQAG